MARIRAVGVDGRRHRGDGCRFQPIVALSVAQHVNHLAIIKQNKKYKNKTTKTTFFSLGFFFLLSVLFLSDRSPFAVFFCFVQLLETTPDHTLRISLLLFRLFLATLDLNGYFFGVFFSLFFPFFYGKILFFLFFLPNGNSGSCRRGRSRRRDVSMSTDGGFLSRASFYRRGLDVRARAGKRKKEKSTPTPRVAAATAHRRRRILLGRLRRRRRRRPKETDAASLRSIDQLSALIFIVGIDLMPMPQITGHGTGGLSVSFFFFFLLLFFLILILIIIVCFVCFVFCFFFKPKVGTNPSSSWESRVSKLTRPQSTKVR